MLTSGPKGEGPVWSKAVILAAVLAGFCGIPAVARAEGGTSTRGQLQKIEAERDAARERVAKLESGAVAVARELADIGADLTSSARESRRLEQELVRADKSIAGLRKQSSALAETLHADRDAVRELLAALMVWGSRRPPTLATPAKSNADAVRAAILMSHAAPAIDLRARELSERIAGLADMRSQIENRKETLAATELILAARRAHIEALAREKRAVAASLSRQSRIARSHRDDLARQAGDLQGLLEALARRAPSAPRLRPPAPKPVLPRATSVRKAKPARVTRKALNASRRRPVRPTSPANGELVASFGQRSVGGDTRAGVTYVTRSSAQVLAPLDGRVEYAGSFRSYGNIVILDVGKGYLVVLAGMEKVYAEEGQSVLSGEPVGQMAVRGSPRLYFEVRRNGKPIDPKRWISQEV